MAKRSKHKHDIRPGRIHDWPDDAAAPEEVAKKVRYTGSPQHKTYPSSAGPPALKADKAKCDQFAEADWPKLLDALRKGIEARCTGEWRGDFPSRVWVWINDVLHEARLTAQGDYHGFPIDDPSQYPAPARELEKAPRVTIAIVRS
jgi:hypothetical protein